MAAAAALPPFTVNQKVKIEGILEKVKVARDNFSDALPNVKLLRDREVFGKDYKEAKKPLNAARQAFDSAKAELSKLLLSIFSKEFGKDSAVVASGVLSDMVPPLEE